MSKASTKYFKRSSKERREYIDIIRCFNKFMKFIDQVDFSGRNQHHARERQNAVDKLNGLRKVKAVISNKRGALLEGRAILASQDMIIEMYQWLEIDFIIYKNGSIAVAVHHSYADYNVADQTNSEIITKKIKVMKSREKRDKMLKIIFNFIKAYRYSDVFPYRGQTNKQGVFDLIK